MFVVEGDREFCPVCRFEWASVAPEEVAGRVRAATGSIADALVSDLEGAVVRPEPDRWSSLEYGAHVRDVLWLIRDRLVNTVVEDTPSPPKLHRDERVSLGLYASESPESVARQLPVAAQSFATFFDVLHPENHARTVIYSADFGNVRTLAWTGAQAVHECEHHLGDVEENARRLGAG
jgi:hypothetical protein